MGGEYLAKSIICRSEHYAKRPQFGTAGRRKVRSPFLGPHVEINKNLDSGVDEDLAYKGGKDLFGN